MNKKGIYYFKVAENLEGLDAAKPMPLELDLAYTSKLAEAIKPKEQGGGLVNPHSTYTGFGFPVYPPPKSLIDPQRIDELASAVVARIRRLEAICSFAELIIATYEGELRSARIEDLSKAMGDTLASVGFCQGRVFKDAADKIRRALAGEDVPTIIAYEPHEPSYEDIALSYERIKATLVCEACGVACDPMQEGAAWRFNGRGYEHTHSEAAQAGHFNAIPKEWYAKLKANPLP